MNSSPGSTTSFSPSRAAGRRSSSSTSHRSVAEQSRTYEGGVAQSFLSERGMLRVSYFHNQYGRQIEPVPATEVPTLLPQLSPSEQQAAGEPAQQRGRPRSELAGIPRPGN